MFLILFIASKYCIPPKKKMPVYNPSPINGYVPPIGTEKITNLIGEFRGIQGQHNSCYMDATLFAMFAFNNTFDSILVRPRRPKDPEVFNDIQKLLKECVVNNLRKRHFVHWKSVMQIRQLLVGLSRDSGMTTDERDPEEFLELLLGKCFDVAPFLKFNNGNELYVYQMFLENTNVFSVPTFEQLLHHSFKMFDLRLSKVPSVLVVQLPRSGNKFKSFRRYVNILF